MWAGTYYKGSHEPIVSKVLFDQVQVALGFSQRPKMVRNNFPYAGLLSCGECGCAITGEEHRKTSGSTYTYYRCANGKGHHTANGPSPLKYVPEAKLEKWFSEALETIRIPEDVIEWTRQALLDSARDEQSEQEEERSRLTARYERLQGYVSRAYEDRLEGKIDDAMWEDQTARWKKEQTDLEDRLAALRTTDTNYMLEGIRFLELARNAPRLFHSMTPDEKREILNLVLLNPKIEKGALQYSYKTPFAMFSNVTDLEKWRDAPSRRNFPFPPREIHTSIAFLVHPKHLDPVFLHQKYVAEGLSLGQISALIFSSKDAVRRGLKTAGIPLREPHRNHGRQAQLPSGLKKIKDAVVEHRGERRACDAILKMYEQGLSLRAIASVLDEMKMPTKCRGRKWHPQMVQRILARSQHG